jgi:hypothetical protein
VPGAAGIVASTRKLLPRRKNGGAGHFPGKRLYRGSPEKQ